MVTALPPVISYDKAAAISYYAIDHNQSLKQAALANGVSEERSDRVIDPLAPTRPGRPTPRRAPGTLDITAPEAPWLRDCCPSG
jgi:aspartate ammonia-lyase